MASRFQSIGFDRQLTLFQKLALFTLFTVLLVVASVMLLPVLTDLGPFGYVGGFIINGFSSATVVIPGPGFAAVMVMAKDLNPFLLGIAAGVGGTLGELSGYWLGAQGSEPLDENRIYNFIQKGMKRFGGGIIFIFSLIPLLPIDAAGIIAGATRYPIPKFLFYLGIGKVVMTVTILYLVAKAFEWAEPYLKWLS